MLRTWLTQRGRTIALVLLAVVVIGGAVFAVRRDPGGDDTPTPTGGPNFVVIMTDDQTLESMRVMTSVDELIADEGITFAESIVSFALCCPARATFLTGQYTHNHEVWGNQLPLGGYESFAEQETALPAALQRAGYDTIHVGKFLNGYGSEEPAEVPPGWTEWRTELDPRAQRYHGFTMLEDGEERTYDDGEYSTDVFTELATSAIRRRADSEDPFFLNVSYFAPHADFSFEEGLTPATPASRHLGELDGEPLPESAAFDEADVSDKPEEIQALPRITADVRATLTSNYARYLESLLAVDEGVEQIFAALEDTGHLDDTVVIFTSDNGYFFGEHRIASGKVRFYEPSIRVPLLMRGPGIEAGATRRSLVANIDLAPTILELAGATSMRTMDGRSLVPLFDAEGAPEDRGVLLESTQGGPSDLTPNFGLRTTRYTYVELSSGERELYDLQSDPSQLVNRAGDPELATVEADLAARVATLKDCAGTTCQ